MRYRRLGKTEFMVSEVSFGAHVDQVNVQDEKRRAEQIRAGIEAGINLFDIYDHSGYKQWEPMSRLLWPTRDRVIISLCTVWDAGKVMEEVDYALKVFRTDRIDLYRYLPGKDEQENEQRLSTLLKAKEQGKVKAVGAVVHVPSETRALLNKHSDDIEFLMAPIAFCFRKALSERRPIARKIREHGIGLIAMKALCSHADDRGSGTHLLQLPPPSVEPSHIASRSMNLGKLAIQALLESDLVDSVMPTMNSVEEVLADVQASGAGPLTEDERHFLNHYWLELQRKGKEFLGPHQWMWNWR